ncbi:hypothetical protein PV379_03150 [Streptomyces caniscabiei]|uniref:hypothetical protein n=1 Tax=Streptomyces caniscabiei TaxID=2746961 RepID=UPI0029A6A3F5|nr:hypothetical protein [Streptomyces caniscabiei]MDX2776340.1 hypothetical protein [Streptomyces caniscabiei]
MNPDQNPYSIDYLNQIAPQSQKQGAKDKFFFWIIGGGLLVAIVVFLFTLSNTGGGPKEDMQTLAARMATLQTVASDTQKNLKSSDLRSTNSNLTIFLANANRDITEPLSANGIDVKKLDASIVAKESGDKLTQTFEDARLNAVLDRTYAREMTYQLQTVSVLIRDIYESTNSKTFKTYLEKIDADLQPLITQFSDFSGAEG